MNRVQELYAIIKEAQEELEDIRTNCKHLSIFLGNYTYSDASRIQTGYICNDCGDFLGDMKTAKEWIENPQYHYEPYYKIKKYLLQNEYNEDKLSWDQFTTLTDYNSLTGDKVNNWFKAQSRDQKIDDIIK